jgi:hypothetical protein
MSEVSNFNGKGTFEANNAAGEFLATNKVAFDDLADDFRFVGHGDNDNWVAFTVPKSLVGNGPHTVANYAAPVEWQVKVKGALVEFESAEAKITFADRYRSKVTGTITFVLKDKTTVDGKFDIEQK